MKYLNKFLCAKVKIKKGKLSLLKLLLKKKRDFDRSIVEDFDRQIFGNK